MEIGGAEAWTTEPPLQCVFPSRFRKNDGVDDVDNAVVGDEVGLHDFGVVDRNASIGDFEFHGLTLDGFGFHRFYIGGHDFAGDNMVGEDCDELLFVFRFEQVFDSAGGQLGEGFVGGSKNREGSFALERFDQAGSFDRCDERFEVVGARGDSDDIFAGGVGFGGFLVMIGRGVWHGSGDEGERGYESTESEQAI